MKREEIALFLFAHQDDEFGVFQAILDELAKKRIVQCVYVTDGGFNGASPEVRNNESLSVLKKLGVNETGIFFAGSELSVPDAHLYLHMEKVFDWLSNFLEVRSNIASIFVPAWEGGNVDHDSLHAITVILAKKLGILERVKQFPIYNAYRCFGPLYRVFKPIPANGTVLSLYIPWRNRFKLLRLCLSYPSQAKAWIGLFPFVLSHYIFSGKQFLQKVSINRIAQRPHEGLLYYESRGFLAWDRMHIAVQNFLASTAENNTCPPVPNELDVEIS